MSNSIEGILGVSMEKIREMVDVNSVIGEPISTPDGETIIPVSKVSVGFGGGGSDFTKKTAAGDNPFGGGVGGGVSTQANTVAERFAQKLGGYYRFLHLPDGLSEAAADELARLPQVREPLELVRHADVLLYGIGTVLTFRRAAAQYEKVDL